MPETPPPALRQVELANSRLLGLAVVGKMTTADYELLDNLIDEQITVGAGFELGTG